MKWAPKFLIVACLLVLTSCQKVDQTDLENGSIAFNNQSTHQIIVTDLLFDGQQSGVPCGYLGPKTQKEAVGMFPANIPNSFQIEYQDSVGSKHIETLDAGLVKTVLHSNSTAKEATIYFVFTADQKFILKIYLGSTEGSNRLMGGLYPDENDPAFKSYKELLRAATDGNAQP